MNEGNNSMKRVITVLAACAIALTAVGTSVAAPPEPQPFNCSGLGNIQILVGPANGADTSFGAARIAGGGILIPVSFQFSAVNVTRNSTIFDSGLIAKGSGNGNRNQTTTACSLTDTGTLADFLEPGETVPPGSALTDTVTFTIAVNAIVKP